MRLGPWTLLALATGCLFKADADGPFECGADGACPEDWDCDPVSRMCVIEGTVPDAAVALPPDARVIDEPDAAPAGVPWWDPAWPRRHRLVIASDLGVPAGFTLGVSGGGLPAVLAADGGASLRVVRHPAFAPAAPVELHRVIDPGVGPGGAGPVWFALAEPIGPAVASEEYYLYVGHPAPPEPPADEAQVFAFFEGFDVLPGSLQADGPVTVEGGELRLDAGERVRTSQTWGAGFAVETRARQLLPGPITFFGFHGDGSFADDRPALEWATTAMAPGQARPELDDDGLSGVGAGVTLDDTARIYGVERPTDAQVVFTAPGSAAPQPFTLPVTVGAAQWRAGSSATIVKVDWVRVRAVLPVAPTVTIGPLELAP